MTTVNPPGAGTQAFAFPAAPAYTAPPPAPTTPPGGSTYEAPAAAPEAAFRPEDAVSKMTEEEIRQKVDEANKVLEGFGYRLSFGFWEGTREFYAQLVDRQTNEVIKTIPSEDILKFHAKLQEALGLLIDEKV